MCFKRKGKEVFQKNIKRTAWEHFLFDQTDDWWCLLQKLKKETERKEKISRKKKQAKGEDKVEDHKKGKKWATNNNKNLLQKKLKYQKLTKETKNTKTPQNKIN